MPIQTPVKRPNTFLELLYNIAIPSIILMKLSTDEYLGTVPALIFALLFPLGYGLYDFIKNKSMNFISLLGFFSTLLTGGIGLFELDVEWLAIKEAAIPSVIGIVVLISGFWGKPLIAKILLNPLLFNLDLIYQTLASKNKTDQFKARIQWANHLLASTFVFSATMNYLLAKWIVISPAGTVEFNEQLGEMTLLSYPVIAIPSMVMLIAIMFYVVKSTMKLTDLTLEKILNGEK
ncbi:MULTISPECIES: VC0807 family protein [unclassified Colwellia]|uniref:VC0807 family protein n=1 Tax=unclassified Colwellia TaxID=196834 RepID=UPI0015F356AE|nr:MULTISPECIES: VC0807 family protein [unclassified Colwellia]MBA6347440.1 MFS transporter [Colwellia sp. BRX8-9]MBA6350806.1 MFS transporter [Colwellia sp. BRX9-1]